MGLSTLISVRNQAMILNRELRHLVELLSIHIPEDLASDFVYEVIDFDKLIEELEKEKEPK